MPIEKYPMTNIINNDGNPMFNMNSRPVSIFPNLETFFVSLKAILIKVFLPTEATGCLCLSILALISSESPCKMTSKNGMHNAKISQISIIFKYDVVGKLAVMLIYKVTTTSKAVTFTVTMASKWPE